MDIIASAVSSVSRFNLNSTQFTTPYHTTQCASVDHLDNSTTMAHNLPPHMANLSMDNSRPSPPPGMTVPPPGFNTGGPPPGFQHQMGAQGPQMTGTPPPGFGPRMMDQMQQPGTPGQAPPQAQGTPQSMKQGNGPRRGPGGSQNLGMPPQQVPQQLPPQMFTTAAQLLDLTDSMYTLSYFEEPGSVDSSSHIELGPVYACIAQLACQN